VQTGRVWRVAAFLVTSGVVVVACGDPLRVGSGSSLANVLSNAACPELSRGAMNASFAADPKENATIRAFVTAAGSLSEVAAKAEADVAAACSQMGQDLDVPREDMEPQGNQRRVAAACSAVAARIDAILQRGASASVRADVTAPRCEANASAAASCKSQCEADVDPGNVEASCAPGRLYGRCTGTCRGRCDGDCKGACDGHCAAEGPGGECAGRCNGTCNGTCSADCRGECTGEFVAPKCEASVERPRVEAHCKASCDAHADLRASCTPAKVNVQANVDAEEITKLVATLERNLPALITAQIAYGERIAGDVQALVRAGAELPDAMGKLTARAGACVASAATATVQAQASLRVTVQASASVSAKAGAGG
jgi:hypothetical protein